MQDRDQLRGYLILISRCLERVGDHARPKSPKAPFTPRLRRTSGTKPDDYPFSTDTSVALIIAKTVSPSLRFIRSTEPVVITDVTIPAAVRMTTSDTTLSETIFSIVPCKRFRMLVLISLFGSGHTAVCGEQVAILRAWETEILALLIIERVPAPGRLCPLQRTRRILPL